MSEPTVTDIRLRVLAALLALAAGAAALVIALLLVRDALQ